MTIEELATELGIDLATAKPEGLTKVRGYLSEADTKYTSATELAQRAKDDLESAQAEHAQINEYIAKHGESEATRAAREANMAAMAASLDTLKKQGIDVIIPEMPKVPATQAKTNEFDSTAFRADVNKSLIAGFDMNNRYQRLYGKAMPDDLQVLLNEASSARQPLNEYVAKKYDFAGEEKRQSEKAQSERDAKVADEAVKKYREANPVTNANPMLTGGGDSRYSQILKPREAKDLSQFANMSPREKIAASVARSREALAANQ